MDATSSSHLRRYHANMAWTLGRGLGPVKSRRADEAVEDLLAAAVLEVDFELVTLDRRDGAVAELAVEHALAEGEVGAALVAEADGRGSCFQGWLVGPQACPLPARAGARVALSPPGRGVELTCCALPAGAPGRGAHRLGRAEV